jgi:hypothetical protein
MGYIDKRLAELDRKQDELKTFVSQTVQNALDGVDKRLFNDSVKGELEATLSSRIDKLIIEVRQEFWSTLDARIATEVESQLKVKGGGMGNR